MSKTMSKTKIEHLNPEEMHSNPAYTQVVAVSGPVRTVYIGGQDSVDASGQIVGIGDIKKQTEQIFKNLRIALKAAGAGLEHIIKWNIYIVQGQSPQAAFEVFQQQWGSRPNPPLITMLFVAGLAHPNFLVEIDAVAVVPDNET